MHNIPQSVSKNNPLSGFMRQPKIYLRLPSKGIYWEPNSIVIPENGELPVYSMTAKDELAFKTPDALLNGQSTVDVIESCIPSIKDAWKTPNIDLDAILIAIRIATYGEKMEITHMVPNTSDQVTHELDLRILLDSLISSIKWEEIVELDERLTCFLKPLTYKHVTATSIKAFETQRLMQAVNDEKISEEEKIKIVNKSFNVMSDVTIDLVCDSIYAIKTPEAVVEDPKFIKEFIKNADKTVYQKIQNHISKMKETNGLKPLIISATSEQIEKGAPATYELPIGFDNADFFGKSS